ncbi:alanine racemase [Nocardioides sp. GY 10127]|uniref:alanine racemase n=1 Tax=Nocardioides sp. GY 10127 TaxID=2569762 RepID=UPI0010A8527C|nr:alanine racemase [Nocardioides sp. GY 10127]TIC81611.1 amino acid deaminase/aldolase [Nocardioides sp. GY 10127]
MLDLSLPSTGEPGRPWLDPATWWPALTGATRHLDAPLGVLSVDALRWNAHDLLRRADGLPIRVASKSLRVRGALEAVLALPGYAGVLAYTLEEALWLAASGTSDDVVVGYPTASRRALRRLAGDERLAAAVTIMVDDVAQLDLVDAAVPPSARADVRVCLELDAAYRHPLLGHVGTRRSPLREPHEVQRLARAVVERPGFTLVGLMAYEGQIAGLGNAGRGRGDVVRAIQRASAAELAERRGATVAAVRAVAPLEFVNGGGTGSIESTHADASVTEVAAGSGLFGPHLFDTYDHFSPAPAAAFALPVVRRPSGPDADLVTLLGGGWIASGPPGADRQPQVVWPQGLEYLAREGAGEVQTPLRGEAARGLAVGDRVWLRHTKAGELAEHLADLVLLEPDGTGGLRAGDVLPTYRGEGKAFL